MTPKTPHPDKGATSASTPPAATAARQHTSPAEPLVHYNTGGPGNGTPFARAGILLPILMVGMVPSLVLLYISTLLRVQWLFTASTMLTLLLIFGSSIVIVVSGILGAIDYMKQERLQDRPVRNRRH